MNNDTQGSKRLRAEARHMNGFMNETRHVCLARTDSDYGSILEHQLAANLCDDFEQIFPNAADTLAGGEAATFGELLFHPAPSVPALRMMKEFAKQLSQNAWLAYPEDVATVLYYSAIVAAELHGHATITELPQEELLKGYRWARDRNWISTKLKRLFEEALTGKE